MSGWASKRVMGAQTSSLRKSVEGEFERLRGESRDHLVVSELLQLRLPFSSWSVDPAHLGVLFVLDRCAAALWNIFQSTEGRLVRPYTSGT